MTSTQRKQFQQKLLRTLCFMRENTVITVKRNIWTIRGWTSLLQLQVKKSQILMACLTDFGLPAQRFWPYENSFWTGSWTRTAQQQSIHRKRSSLERMKRRTRLKSRLSTLPSLTADYKQWSLLQTRKCHWRGKRAGTGGPSSTNNMIAYGTQNDGDFNLP